jgi:hypothetical protein
MSLVIRNTSISAMDYIFQIPAKSAEDMYLTSVISVVGKKECKKRNGKESQKMAEFLLFVTLTKKTS